MVLFADRSLLLENGGHIEITQAWALSLMNRMELVKRKSTKSKKVQRVENFDNEKSKFLTESCGTVWNPPIPHYQLGPNRSSHCPSVAVDDGKRGVKKSGDCRI